MSYHDEMDDGGDDGNVVRVRGLPWSATAGEIVDFFSACHIIGGQDGVNLTYNREGRQTGEAYILMASEIDVEKALVKHNEHMGRRYVEVFKSKKSEMDWVVKRSGPGMSGGTGDAVVRLRGLPFGCSKEEIAQFFTGLEIVPNGITLPMDHQGRTTGDAYVQFSSGQLADKALEKHKERIGHRYIEIFKSSLKEARGAGGSIPRLMSIPRGSGMGQRSGGMGRPSPYDRSDRYGMSSNMGMGGGMGAMRGRRMKSKMGYFDDEYDEDDFDGMGMNTGMGGMNRMRRMGGGMGGGGMRGGHRGLGGVGKSGVPGSNYMSTTGHSVHMRGLPFQANDEDVIEFFAPLQPMNVEFEYNKQNKPTGEADVDFNTHEEAQQAMKKDRTNMQHRYIELFLNSTPGKVGMGSNMSGSGNTGMGGMGMSGGMGSGMGGMGSGMGNMGMGSGMGNLGSGMGMGNMGMGNMGSGMGMGNMGSGMGNMSNNYTPF